MEFKPFPKMARLNRDIIVTEKIDGTNAQVFITPRVHEGEGQDAGGDSAVEVAAQNQYALAFKDGYAIYAGSRTRWITPEQDNFGFAAWVKANAEELFKLGPGQHFGEWWGKGIQRGYGLEGRKFSLFNTGRWKTVCSDAEGYDTAPTCCGIVPILYKGPFSQAEIDDCIHRLEEKGSVAAPEFLDPEGVVVFHTAANAGFKVTCKDDNKPKTWKEHNKAKES